MGASVIDDLRAGFEGPFSLDHSPIFPEAEIANQAFVIGYLRGLIQAVYRVGPR